MSWSGGRVRNGSAAIVSLVQNSGLIVRMRAMSGPVRNLHVDARRPTPLFIAPRQPPVAVIDADLVGDAITNVLACAREVVVVCKARRWRHTRQRDRARRRDTGRACPSRC